MTNVRTIHVDWYSQRPPRFDGGPQLAYQGDHLSNMVVFDNAPVLPNYYLLVEMKLTEYGNIVTLPAIMLEGPYWVIPNYYTQICQIITYQVCERTETGDYEHHSAKFHGTILPSIAHLNDPTTQEPMFDPYMAILDNRVKDLINEHGEIVVDEETAAEVINSWLDNHPEATTTIEDGAVSEVKLSTELKPKVINAYVTPEMFGAAGDGVTDDTAAVQEALNSGVPCFLNKMYIVTEKIVMPNNSVLFGAGRGACGLSYHGDATTEPVIAIPYTSYYCTIHDVTINGNGLAPGIYDCYGKTPGEFVGIRTQLYNLVVKGYTAYGIYLDAMGSELYNCYIIGTYAYSEIGLYVHSTDNKITDCRIQVNNQYGLYSTLSSNIFNGVKCCVNYKGAYISGNSLVCDIEAQENRSHGIELNDVTYSILNFTLNCNGYVEEGAYGLCMIGSCRLNTIRMTGRKKRMLGNGHAGQELAMVYVPITSYRNTIDACFASAETGDILFFDGIAGGNKITLNGSDYTLRGVLLSQGYIYLNNKCTFTKATAVTDATLDFDSERVDVTLTNLTGISNLCLINYQDLQNFSKVVVAVETGAGDFSNYNGMDDYMKLNYPVLKKSDNSTVNPTSREDIVGKRCIVSVFEDLQDAVSIIFRTSSENSCSTARNTFRFLAFGLPAND